MLRYTGTALALKAASVPPFDSIYRWAGNYFGSKKRLKRLPEYYYNRIRDLAMLQEKYTILKNGDSIIELGTGWLHWDSINVKMQFDISATLYDVWDCRQFKALKQQARFLLEMVTDLPVPTKRAGRVLKAIIDSQTIEEMYDRLDFNYVCSEAIPLDRTYDFVVSGGVLEHVPDVEKLVSNYVSTLSPEAYVLHTINLADHLTYYGSKCHPKKYLEIPDWGWRLFFNNRIQHQNRWQRDQYYSCFENNGLVLIDESCSHMDQKVNCSLEPTEAQCVWVRCLHQLTSD